MKTSNKSNVLSLLSGAAFLLLQTFSTTAHADYKGYWVDAVNAHQAQYAQDYQPMATPDYDYSVAAYDQYANAQPIADLTTANYAALPPQHNGVLTAPGQYW